jgi:hypothetical protein
MFKIGLVEFDIGHNAGGASYGDQTVYQVEVNPGTLEEAHAMRLQLLGHKGDIVGVTWDDDPMVDGLYRLTDVSVAPVSNYLATGRMVATVALRTVPDTIETSYHFSVRDDLTPANLYISPAHGFPLTTSMDESAIEEDTAYGISGTTQEGTPDGTLVTFPFGGIAYSTAVADPSIRQGCVPKWFELGRCRIEVQDPAGSYGWWTLTDDKVPEGHDVRIGNGRYRTTVVAGASYAKHERFAYGTGWVYLCRYYFEWDYTVRPTDNEFSRRFEVIRNDRASVVLRCALTLALQPTFYVTFSSFRSDPIQKALISGGMGAPSKIARVWMRTTAGANQTSTDEGSYLKTTATVSGEYGYLYADTTGITLNTAYSTVVKTASTHALVGLGEAASDERFATEAQIFDRSVH